MYHMIIANKYNIVLFEYNISKANAKLWPQTKIT